VTSVRLRVAHRLADGSRLRFTTGEASALQLPLYDATLPLWVGGRELTASWEAQTSLLTVADVHFASAEEAVIARAATGELSLDVSPTARLHNQRPLTPAQPVRDALEQGVHVKPEQLVVAGETALHRASNSYRSQRRSQLAPWSAQVSSSAASSLAMETRPHRLLVGADPQRVATGLRWCIEALNDDRCDRVYIATPHASAGRWRASLDEAAHLLGGLPRGNITFVAYAALPGWRPPPTGRSLLVADQAEQAMRRWPNRVQGILERATCSLVLGAAGADGHAPAWAEELLEGLSADAALFYVAEVRPTARLARRQYLPSHAELTWREAWLRLLREKPPSGREASDLMAQLGGLWHAPQPSSSEPDPRLRTAVEVCREQMEAGRQVEVWVSSARAANALQQLLVDPGSTAPGNPRRSERDVRVRLPGDVRPASSAAIAVYADLAAFVQDPSTLSTGIAILATGTTDEYIFDVLAGFVDVAERYSVTLEDVLPGPAWRWPDHARRLLCGPSPRANLLEEAPQRAQRVRHRGERLQGRSRTDRVSDPVGPVDDEHLRQRHIELIATAMRARGFEFKHADAGSLALQVTSVSGDRDLVPLGSLLVADESAVLPSDVVAVGVWPGNPVAERLLDALGAGRVSIEVASLPALEAVPIAPHVERLHLVGRSYRRPQTGHVTGTYLTRSDETPAIETIERGGVISHGRERRPTPVDVNDPGIPDGNLLSTLVDQLEALETVERTLVSARFVGGDDIMLEELWRRDDGQELRITCLAPQSGPPALTDAAGGSIRVLDTCDNGHAADSATIERCERCSAERCFGCVGEPGVVRCRLCRSEGCSSCVRGGLCSECHDPLRAPEHDAEGVSGWRISGALLLVGRSSVAVNRDDTNDVVTYAPDTQCGTDLDSRRRGLLAAHGLRLDAPVVRAPEPRLDADRSLWCRERGGHDWARLDRSPPGSEPITDPVLLGDVSGPVVRPMSAMGLTVEWLQYRHRIASIRPSPALVWLPHVDRSTLTIESDGLRYRTTRYRGDGSSMTIEERTLDLEQPITPRNDRDGRLLAVANLGDVHVELLSVNASVVLRITEFGSTQDRFAATSDTVTHESELAWHHLARSYGASEGAVVVRSATPLAGAAPAAFADPTGAELVERSVAPFATFSVATTDDTPVDAQDLATLRRGIAPQTSSMLSAQEARHLHQLARSCSRVETEPLRVGVAFSITEQWQAAGTRVVSFVAADGSAALPVLDDTGEPGSEFSVDSAGHLHLLDRSHHCEACDRQFCRVCPTDTELDPCLVCRQLACGPCRSREDVGERDDGSACRRCGRCPCAACGRSLDLRTCRCCSRELCRWCVTDRDGFCSTCLELDVADSLDVPTSIPTVGCTLFVARDADATIVVLLGGQREEILLLRDEVVLSWISLHPEFRETVTVIAAARRWGRDVRVEGVSREYGALHEPPQASVWAERREHLELGPRGDAALSADATDGDFMDVLAATVDDAGPYPFTAASRQRFPRELSHNKTGQPLRIIRRWMQSSVEVDASGLTWRRDRWKARKRIEREHVPWQVTAEPEQGRQRLASRVGPVACELVVAGRDVELRVETGDNSHTYVVADSQHDLCVAALFTFAGHGDTLLPSIVGAVVPGAATPLQITGRGLVDRSLATKARTAEARDPLTTTELMDACVALGVEYQRRIEAPDARFAEALYRYAQEPTASIELGVQVRESFVDGQEVDYEIWPDGDAIYYEYEARTVTRLVIDVSNHVVESVATCRYCARATCRSCEQAVRACMVCSIAVCGRCSAPGDLRLCSACRRLAKASVWASRKLFDTPRPWKFLRGSDVRHDVTLARTRTGFRLVSEGGLELTDTPVHLAGSADAHVHRMFDR
jgi:hypothetical protein